MKDTAAVTLNTIQDSMLEKYRYMCAKNYAFGQGTKSSSKSPTETGLADVGGIVCYKCKQPGHKANDLKCPMKGQPYPNGSGSRGNGGGRRGGGKFQGSCNHCGMKYHKSVDCFEKPENANRRPPNWKSKMNTERETNAAAVSGSGTPSELNVVAVTFASNMELLKDPDVFIGDTGATCDLTATAFGMYACRDGSCAQCGQYCHGRQ